MKMQMYFVAVLGAVTILLISDLAPTANRAGSRHVEAPAISGVVAGLVPATPIIAALRLNIRGRRDKPGDDTGM
ncbi:MAG TPA: hypothetical protein VKP67_02955 [Xanthobacteraceae bacterium]|nr:hypothetical protein [Xanthobacteraceae bacterium]